MVNSELLRARSQSAPHVYAVNMATLAAATRILPTKSAAHQRRFRSSFSTSTSSSRRAAVVTAASSSAPSDTLSRAVRFRPCIDIHQGRVKQIVGGTLKDADDGSAASETPETNFETETSSAEFARTYQRDGIYGGHVIMLSRDDATLQAAIDAVGAFPGGLQVGGGVTADTAMPLIDAGASHVIVTSYVFRDGAVDQERLAATVAAVGKHRLVLDLSCRKRGDDYFVVTDRWQKWTDLKVDAETMETLSRSCDEFLVHGVDVEGMKLGIDEDLVRLLGVRGESCVGVFSIHLF